MQSLTGKVTGGNLTAAEWNQLPQEVQNLITDNGLSLSSGDLDQLGKGIANFAAAGNYFNETGAADAYVCSIIGTKQGITAYQDGALIRFRPSNANTGASTLNINGIGTKDIKREDASILMANDLATTRDAIVRYDSGADDFFLLNGTLDIQPPVGFSPAGHIHGFQFTWTDKDTLVAGIGTCRDFADTQILALTSAMSKELLLDASWSSGAAGNAVPSIAQGVGLTGNPDIWMHLYIIGGPTATTDWGLDTSLTATNLLSAAGAAFIRYRHVGWVRTTAVADGTLEFFQEGNRFFLKTVFEALDVLGVDIRTILTQVTELPPGPGIECVVGFHIQSLSSGDDIHVGHGNQIVPGGNGSGSMIHMDGVNGATFITAYPNASRQVTFESDTTNLTANLQFGLYNWTDDRGREF